MGYDIDRDRAGMSLADWRRVGEDQSIDACTPSCGSGSP